MLVENRLGVVVSRQVNETVLVGSELVWKVPKDVEGLRVLAGTAWVTIDDEDFIAERGQVAWFDAGTFDVRVSSVAVSKVGPLTVEVIRSFSS